MNYSREDRKASEQSARPDEEEAQEEVVVGIGWVVALRAERVMMYSTNSERAGLVGSGSRTRMAHAEVDKVGKALMKYCADLSTAVLPLVHTASTV